MSASHRTRSLGGQLRVLESPGIHDPTERVTEDVRVIAVVETPLKLFEVTVKVLHADVVEGPNDRALEQAPDVLDGVRVNVSPDPLRSLSTPVRHSRELTLSEGFDDEREVDEGGKHHVELVKAGEDPSLLTVVVRYCHGGSVGTGGLTPGHDQTVGTGSTGAVLVIASAQPEPPRDLPSAVGDADGRQGFSR